MPHKDQLVLPVKPVILFTCSHLIVKLFFKKIKKHPFLTYLSNLEVGISFHIPYLGL